jgi:hypothetical protein
MQLSRKGLTHEGNCNDWDKRQWIGNGRHGAKSTAPVPQFDLFLCQNDDKVLEMLAIACSREMYLVDIPGDGLERVFVALPVDTWRVRPNCPRATRARQTMR